MKKKPIQFLNIPRYDGKHEVFKTERCPVPDGLTRAIPEIKSYMRAHARKEAASKKMTPSMVRAIKSQNADDLLEMGYFLSRLHIWEARFFYEKAFRLNPDKIQTGKS